MRIPALVHNIVWYTWRARAPKGRSGPGRVFRGGEGFLGVVGDSMVF